MQAARSTMADFDIILSAASTMVTYLTIFALHPFTFGPMPAVAVPSHIANVWL